jgi:hypothetical protein
VFEFGEERLDRIEVGAATGRIRILRKAYANRVRKSANASEARRLVYRDARTLPAEVHRNWSIKGNITNFRIALPVTFDIGRLPT